jgi:hypothetical protein
MCHLGLVCNGKYFYGKPVHSSHLEKFFLCVAKNSELSRNAFFTTELQQKKKVTKTFQHYLYTANSSTQLTFRAGIHQPKYHNFLFLIEKVPFNDLDHKCNNRNKIKKIFVTNPKNRLIIFK